MLRLQSELPLTSQQLEDVFDSLDDDANGCLTLQEFTGGFGKYPPLLSFYSNQLRIVPPPPTLIRKYVLVVWTSSSAEITKLRHAAHDMVLAAREENVVFNIFECFVESFGWCLLRIQTHCILASCEARTAVYQFWIGFVILCAGNVFNQYLLWSALVRCDLNFVKVNTLRVNVCLLLTKYTIRNSRLSSKF